MHCCIYLRFISERQSEVFLLSQAEVRDDQIKKVPGQQLGLEYK